MSPPLTTSLLLDFRAIIFIPVNESNSLNITSLILSLWQMGHRHQGESSRASFFGSFLSHCLHMKNTAAVSWSGKRWMQIRKLPQRRRVNATARLVIFYSLQTTCALKRVQICPAPHSMYWVLYLEQPPCMLMAPASRFFDFQLSLFVPLRDALRLLHRALSGPAHNHRFYAVQRS